MTTPDSDSDWEGEAPNDPYVELRLARRRRAQAAVDAANPNNPPAPVGADAGPY